MNGVHGQDEGRAGPRFQVTQLDASLVRKWPLRKSAWAHVACGATVQERERVVVKRTVRIVMTVGSVSCTGMGGVIEQTGIA